MKHPSPERFRWWWSGIWEEYGRQDEIAASEFREGYMLSWEQGVAGWKK